MNNPVTIARKSAAWRAFGFKNQPPTAFGGNAGIGRKIETHCWTIDFSMLNYNIFIMSDTSFTVTARAAKRIHEIAAKQGAAAALRVAVNGGGCSGFQYGLMIEENGQGAGDQGLMFGYACDDTDDLMPMPIWLAHRLARRLTAVRKEGILDYLRPDGKTQVSIVYEDGKPKALTTVREVVEGDPEYLRLLGLGAQAELVDEVGMLWLTRPDGWLASAVEVVRPDVEADDEILRQLQEAGAGTPATA